MSERERHSKRPHDDDQHNESHRKRRRDGKEEFHLDREERMARLRQEMKHEDEELAAALEEPDLPPPVRPQEEIVEVNAEELEGLDEEEQMRKLMGLEGFGSTKGAAVADNQSTAARGVAAKNKARKYRQYMNRKNGFNRPLEKMD